MLIIKSTTGPALAMSKKSRKPDSCGREPSITKKAYKDNLHHLQVELVKLQRHFIECDDKILIILEGRDAAGKDGVIKRLVQHLSPRETRVVALGKPSDRDRKAWYFQRYIPYLPVAQELVLFNRSWYNRAGVERVMGFCSEAEHEEFMASVLEFENMLMRSGINLLKYYLDIGKKEQTQRLADRKTDPLKRWKISPIDDKAIKYWKAYSAARNEMLARTHTPKAPWTLVRADNKRLARLNVIRDVLSRLHYSGKDKRLTQPDPQIVFAYDASDLENSRLAR
jgi:polyphosphate kinase 2